MRPANSSGFSTDFAPGQGLGFTSVTQMPRVLRNVHHGFRARPRRVFEVRLSIPIVIWSSKVG
jgi:hypothetical protein